MKNTLTRCALLGALLGACLGAPGVSSAAPMTEARLAELLDAYNVVWDSPSQDANGSMPLGNGDVGVNVWVEPSGDLVFYISKTDAWDENARLCKIGRVRVKFEPALQAGASFRQELKLREGAIEIESTVDGESARIRLWVDADRPIVRVQAETKARTVCRAEVELWRKRERPFGPDDSHSGNGLGQMAFKPTVLPDEVVQEETPRVAWFHRNTRSLYEPVLKAQNLDALVGQFPDPLLNHTFGASLRGAKMIKDSPQTLKSAEPATAHELAVCVVAEQTETSAEWVAKLDRAEHAIWRTAFEKARKTTADWWRAFWSRSWVFVEEPGDAAAPGQSPVTRGYLLQRFISAAAARGGSPIKFNGTIFNVEARPGASPETPDGDPDWRRWGGNYWFQNTRLVYWPMLASGDFDMMPPMFRMYQDAIPLSMARAKAYYNLDGAAVFPETMYFWGLPNMGDFGLNNPGPELTSNYIRRHWNGGIELTAMMLEYYHHTRDESSSAARCCRPPIR
jgi:alpha-L-fucosidase 2